MANISVKKITKVSHFIPSAALLPLQLEECPDDPGQEYISTSKSAVQSMASHLEPVSHEDKKEGPVLAGDLKEEAVMEGDVNEMKNAHKWKH